MIREQDLLQAIAECQGERNPNANTCIKLAAFYTIRDHLYPQTDAAESALPVMQYSKAARPRYDSDSEFYQLIADRDPDEVWPIMDELMDTLRMMMPRLYDSVMRRLVG